MSHFSYHKRFQVLALAGLCAISGCASFFGPYQAVSANSAALSALADQSNATDEPASGDSQARTVRYHPEFDTTSRRPDDQADVASRSAGTAGNAESGHGSQTGVGARSADTLSLEASDTAAGNNVFDTPPVAGEMPVLRQEENPFAVMAREDRQQAVLKAPEATTVQRTAAVFARAPSATTFREAEPRLPTPQPGCPQPAECCVAASPLVQAYPDEYICDGGDRHHPVHYFGGEMQGLDTEDTVAEFKDHEGDNHVRASNRVCVYAPRFGAVQTVNGPEIDVSVNHAAAARDVAAIGALQEDRSLETSVASNSASGLGTRRSASGVETSQPAHMSEKTVALSLANKVDQGMEAKTADGLGILRASDVHELNLHVLEPAASNINTRIEARGATTQATSTYSTFRVQSMLGTEDGGRKGEIHITKEAAPLVAVPGDDITFKIHFRNTGDYNIHDVRIIDNLTPRLTYIEGSGQIEVRNESGGGLTVVPNKEGSQTLIFELDAPLKGGESGVITFQAKVR